MGTDNNINTVNTDNRYGFIIIDEFDYRDFN